MEMRAYQTQFVTNIAIGLTHVKKLVAQLATGGGKTRVFSAICRRYIDKSNKDVLILVHRKELLKQTRKTLYDAEKIICQPIIAGMRTIPKARVYVGMVESVNRRVERLTNNIGLVIIDEAHLAVHNKMHEHWPNQLIIGFTATPLSASRKNPMKNWYQDIVCGIDIPDLIRLEALSQNITFAPKDTVDRAALTIKNGEFDEGLMGMSFSKPKYINNTVVAYEKHAKGTKTIVFNCTIDHSKLVEQAFKGSGYKVRHLDGETSANERDQILNWFKTTPDAILCNCNIATTGFDEPTIETVIVNRSTMSMPFWLQVCGRGSRRTAAKSAFTIIDMGGNAIIHGDWCYKRDWENIFHNPPKPGADGIAPLKTCPQCEALVPISTKVCKFCGYEFPAPQQAEENPLQDFVIVTRGINVKEVIEENKHRKEYFPFFNIGSTLAYSAKQTIPRMTDENAAFILKQYCQKAEEWCKLSGKRWNQWHYEKAKEHLFAELQKNFRTWKPQEITV
jgi:superfamily II DNA or RNA helicase